MRGTVDGLESSHPLADALPPLYLEARDDDRDGPDARDSLVVRFTSALDAVLAPATSALDNLDAYLDPRLAPADFVEWLATWVGLALDERWPDERRRELVGRTVELYRARGTPRGLAEELRILTGSDPDIVEGGAVAWSTTPDSPFPGKPGSQVKIRVRVAKPDDVDLPRVRALVSSSVPAHVVPVVELTSS